MGGGGGGTEDTARNSEQSRTKQPAKTRQKTIQLELSCDNVSKRNTILPFLTQQFEANFIFGFN